VYLYKAAVEYRRSASALVEAPTPNTNCARPIISP
jgi:hypothetical protein